MKACAKFQTLTRNHRRIAAKPTKELNFKQPGTKTLKTYKTAVRTVSKKNETLVRLNKGYGVLECLSLELTASGFELQMDSTF